MTRNLTRGAALSVTLIATLATAPAALADAHGNKWVHSREFQGETYVMYYNHMALYTYDEDARGKSNCTGECAEKWPPAVLDPGTPLGEGYSLIEREDGRMQAAFRGRPLYLWSGDSRPGDRGGDGLGGKWRLARP